MKLEQIELKNYRQYKDTTITFATSEDQSLTVIEGANGAGKTNILNAVTWCLYGQEKHLDKNNVGYPLANTATFRRLEPGKKFSTKVQVILRDEGGKKITAERSLEFQALKGEKIQTVGNPRFRLLQQVNGEIKSANNPEYVLSGLIPESIEEYFFFDGERMKNYFLSTSGGRIRQAVLRISQIDLLESAIKHLKSTKNDFLRKEKGLSPNVKEIREELLDSEGLLKEYEEKLSVLERRERETEREETELSEKLRTSPVANVGELERERVEINKRLESLDTEIKNLEQERFDYLTKVAPVVFAYDAIVGEQRLIEQRKEAGDIPPNFKRSFLEKLLETGKCICGTGISEGVCRDKIKQLLRECSGISDISSELIEEHANLRSMVEELEYFRESQTRYGQTIRGLERDRYEKSERLKGISEKLAGVESEQIKKWEQRLADRRDIRVGLAEEIGELKFHRKEIKKKIGRLNTELEKELRKKEDYEELSRNMTFCDRSLNALEGIRGGILEDVRRDIEKKTKSQFFSLIWKRETYKDVRIDKEYNVSVVDNYGMEGLGTLSAGESQMLALSLIAALNSVSGFNVPIIIDTPLGRMARESKRNIASNLLKYLKGKQVILLMTDEEYTQEVREKLSERVGKEYKIDFKETVEGAEAEVVPYAIWEYGK